MAYRAASYGVASVDDDDYIPGARAGAAEDGLHAGQAELASLTPLPWYYPFVGWGILSVLVIAAAALGVGIAAIVIANDHSDSAHITGVCNRGSNSGDNLASVCDDVLGVPGLNLVSGDAGNSKLAFLKRIVKGVGVNATSVPDSHIEIGALIVSLNPTLVVGEGSETLDGDRPLTLDLDLSGLNVSSVGSDNCSISGDGTAPSLLALARQTASGSPASLGSEPADGYVRDKIIAESDCTSASNLYVSLPYAGHGVVVGSGHTFPNDGTVDRSAILGGTGNTVNASASAVVGAGTGNAIFGSDRANIVSGSGNTITNSGNSGIGGGSLNSITDVTASDAYIAGGASNSITGGDDSFIGGGQGNTNDGTECFLGAGNGNTIAAGADRSGIVAGDGNSIGVGGTCANCVILGGSGNSLLDASNAAILAGTGISASGSDYDNTAITQHLLVTEAVRTTGVRTLSSTTDTPTASDYLILVETTTAGGTVTVTLDTSVPDGTNLVIKDVEDASGDNIVVDTSGIDLCPIGAACGAAATQTVATQGGSVTVVKTSTAWIVVDA